MRNILHAPERPPRSTEEVAAQGEEEEEEEEEEEDEDEDEDEEEEGVVKEAPSTHYSYSHSCSNADCSQQNQLLWNLFTQGFDRVLINLLSSSRKVVTIYSYYL